MGNFNEIVPRRINISPAREATLAEAQSAPIPFDKYYRYRPTREIGKLKTFFILTANTIDFATAEYFGRLMFQYNVIAPKPFYILNLPRTNKSFSCVLTVKWRVGTTVHRYFIEGWQQYVHTVFPVPPLPPYNDDVHNITAFPIYGNQLVPVNCVFECWCAPYQSFGPLIHGLHDNYKLEISTRIDPATPDDIENDILVSSPIDVIGTQHTVFPIVYPLNAWPDVVYDDNP